MASLDRPVLLNHAYPKNRSGRSHVEPARHELFHRSSRSSSALLKCEYPKPSVDQL